MCLVLDERAAMDRLRGGSWGLTDPRVWPRVARAARDCRVAVIGS
jgi:hypothetical protein